MGVFSNWCGFGGEGIAQHIVDVICQVHDEDYRVIQEEEGINPYLRFNWADAKMLSNLEEHAAQGFKEQIIKAGATAMWKMKRSFSNLLPGTQWERKLNT